VHWHNFSRPDPAKAAVAARQPRAGLLAWIESIARGVRVHLKWTELCFAAAGLCRTLALPDARVDLLH
jgi:hypothetical protein